MVISWRFHSDLMESYGKWLTIEYRMISKVEKMDIHKLPKQQIDIKKNDLDSSKHNADRSGLSFTQTGRTECKVGSHWSNHGIWAWVQTHSLPTWLTSHNQDSSVHLRHAHCNYSLSPANMVFIRSCLHIGVQISDRGNLRSIHLGPSWRYWI